MKLTALACGELQICSLAFRLSSAIPSVSPLSQTPASGSIQTSVAGFVNLEVQGVRLNSSKLERTSKMYAPDRRLSLIITEPSPKLEVLAYFHLLFNDEQGYLGPRLFTFRNSVKFDLDVEVFGLAFT